MSRVKFKKGKQRKFIQNAILFLGTKPSDIAAMLKLCSRTVRGWKREKNNIDLNSLNKLCRLMKVGIPVDIKILPEYWSTKKAGRLGGKRCIQLYGNPGTPEGRRRGGINSQLKARKDPDYARKIGLIVRKKIKRPRYSEGLAEFVGIILGDGCIGSDHQMGIAFDGKKDYRYALYIQKLVKNLFGISSAIRISKEKNRASVIISSTELIEFLKKIGLKNGNKVLNQVDVPRWIFSRKKYQIGCLRGIFDTDGCVYLHKYNVTGKKYCYVKMSFRNYSIPLLISIKKMVEHVGFNPVIDIKHQTVYINRTIEVKKYFLKIKTNNPRYREKFNKFLKKN